MNKTELESKHLAELHALAAEAGLPRYRMLTREELIEKLAGGGPARDRGPRGGRSQGARGGGRERSERAERPGRRRRERPAERRDARRPPAAPEPRPAPEPPREPESKPAPDAATGQPKRKRRRRRFGRRGKGLRIHELLQPPPGRQALVYGESREACTALLREIAGELAEGSIALLVDPSPEELADWKREAPRAELVAAAEARHASDAVAQAVRRAEGGEDVTLLVDSLTKLEDVTTAKAILDAGASRARGSLTVVAALERAS